MTLEVQQGSNQDIQNFGYGNFYFSSPFQGQTGLEGNTSKSDIFFAPLCVHFSHLTLKNPGAGSFHPICTSLRKGEGERKEICIFSRFLSLWGRCFQVEWTFSKVWTEDSVRSDIRGGSRLSSTYKPNICAGKWPVSMFVALVIWLSQQRTDERWSVYRTERRDVIQDYNWFLNELTFPFLYQFSISLGLRSLKFREEFKYDIYASLQTTFHSSTEVPYFYPWSIIGPKGPFSFGKWASLPSQKPSSWRD